MSSHRNHFSILFGPIKSIIILFFFLSLSFAEAQEDKASSSNYFGATMGTFLVQSAIDNLPMWSVLYGYGMSNSAVEVELSNARAHSIEYYLASAGYRIDLDFKYFEGVFFRLGLDYHFFKPRDTQETQSLFGGHFGGGIEISLGSLKVRSEFIMRARPGITLYVGVGLVFPLGASEPEKDTP